MGSGKLVLLLVAGSIGAGILLASATTQAMRSYPKMPLLGAAPHRADPPSPPAYGKSRSWVDEGLSALDIPAWPFGRDEWDGSDDISDDTSADDTGTQDWAGTPAYGDGLQQDFPPGMANPGNAESADAPMPPDTGAVHDAAADAAQRAATAAADVSAAERGGN